MYVGDMFWKNLKMFTHKHCWNLALVGGEFIFWNSSILIWAVFDQFYLNLNKPNAFVLGDLDLHSRTVVKGLNTMQSIHNNNVAVSGHYPIVSTGKSIMGIIINH